MRELSSPTMDQMAAVLDHAPVAVYVNAVDGWDLLYSNRLAEEWMMRTVGGKSGKCFQKCGFDQPCPFCQVGKMNRNEFLVREFRHPADGHIYQLSGKIIDWDGRPAHIEYILDITEKKQAEERTAAVREELQKTFHGIPCGLAVYRSHGGTIDPLLHNPAFYEIMGYSAEHIRRVEQKTEYLGVHPDDRKLLQELIRQAVQSGGLMQHTYRVWNDKAAEYRWIDLRGAVKPQADGSKLLYCIYSDVSEQQRLKKALTDTNEKMQDIINAIPGGVAIYKVSDIFETVYFSEGVPELSGYTVEEYKALAGRDAAEMIYPEDTAMVVDKVRETLRRQAVADFEFRKQHRDGHIVWVRVQAKQIGEEDGCPLLQCVFHNISALKETQLELDHLVNSIPGGIASYKIEGNRFIPTFYSDGVMTLSGHTREEYEEMVHADAMNIIYEPDKARVLAAAEKAVQSGDVLDVSYRMRHKDGSLIWIHLNGCRIGPLSESMRFYAVFTGMSEQTKLFQNIANETADAIYVIDRENYELLYTNETHELFAKGKPCLGQKCYAALHGKDTPCGFCTLHTYGADGEEHEISIDGTDRFYTSRVKETDWNGIPAYVQYIRDVTQEVKTRREKERLEMYFQTLVENLPGGISVIRCDADGAMTPEFISEGFAAMTHMTAEQAFELYGTDIFAGVHPEDVAKNREKLEKYMAHGEGNCELTARMQCGDGGYIWVKSTLSVLQMPGHVRRVYSVYTDISKAVAEKEQMRRQYEEVLRQHYRMPGPDTLILGHCNITQNKILEILDQTNSRLLETFGEEREAFFSGIAGLAVEEEDRRSFLDTYLNAPALAAFRSGSTEKIMKCFVKFPQEKSGRYVQFKVNMVETPDTGDITGILTVTDITEQVVSERILHQLSVTSHDYVIDLDLERDSFTLLSCSKEVKCAPPPSGCHSQRVSEMVRQAIAPKDKELYAAALAPPEIRRRLEAEGAYTFSYSVIADKGDIRTKNMTVSDIDLRLGRVCLVCADITESVREEQGLLHMMAYTFEMMGFLHLCSRRFTMYTRETVLENLSPRIVEHYSNELEEFVGRFGTLEDQETAQKQFRLDTILQGLSEKPSGYDFVVPYRADEGLRYKQIIALWGDGNHSSICLVQADVTDMLAAERESKQKLERALVLAEQANRAKSDFLSAMSHDIRTPMNAIMGMTTLAADHLGDPERVSDCLQKISISSKHLLSLINDVLDMSKIEQGKITLNQSVTALPELLEMLSAMMKPQADEQGVHLTVRTKDISHAYFYGDKLRIGQILINLLSNAVKFTLPGGAVDFLVEEVPPAVTEGCRYRFTVRDTGIGMAPEFLAHIFEPFARGGNGMAARIEGTGLGLSITKGLVDLMGGEIAVESQLGTGSTFRVELECKAAPEGDIRRNFAARVPGEAAGMLFGGRTFLIAEDNEINAEILCALLAKEGAETVVAYDGVQAVRAFADNAPNTYDAVLMDIQMPNMNGYDAARAIRAQQRPDAKGIPIIALTANAFAEDIQAALEAGMNAHVAKPIDVATLNNTLSGLLEEA